MRSRRHESGDLPGTYRVLQRGRKPCPSCDVIIGAGRKACPVCDQKFGTKAETVSPSKTTGSTATVVTGSGGRGANEAGDVLLVPAGKCPAQLQSPKATDVVQWMGRVSSKWRQSQDDGPPTLLSVEAMEWWAREFYSVKSPEHDRVVQTIRKAVNGGL